MENAKKSTYKTPDVELLEFEKSDIITTSGFFGTEDEFSLDDDNGSSASELPKDPGAGR